MVNNDAGEIRRSSVILTYGPGSVIDMRADGGYGGPISGCSTGLDEWDESAPLTSEDLKGQTITEARLSNRLGVRNFRLAPVVSEKNQFDRLVVKRFPEWLQCPRCAVIQRFSGWASDPGSASRYCGSCTQSLPSLQKVFVAPVRFIVACEFGHLEEFPWHYWVRHKKDCANNQGQLKLESKGAGLAGLILSCNSCKSQRSLDGVFSNKALTGLVCKARRPWLRLDDDKCAAKGEDGSLRVLQRGATNVYYPIHVSALAIPPWTDTLETLIGDYWDDLTNADDALQMIKSVPRLLSICERVGLTPEQLASRVEIRIGQLNAQHDVDLKIDEYNIFTDGRHYEQNEFECHPIEVPDSLKKSLSSIVRVPRLREVRALTSFTRIEPSFEGDRTKSAPLSVSEKDWLPGAEIRGEGIFIGFNTKELATWETSKEVENYLSSLQVRWQSYWNDKHPSSEVPEYVSARSLLLHSFSHSLINELTLECGYSSAALKERLYVKEGPTGMAGVLIYTGTTDSEGTLGGLEMRGRSDLIEQTLVNALRNITWCSADPICSSGLMAAPDSFSIASCHSCLLLPETACELHNKFMNRVLIIGSDESQALGYFSSTGVV